jgi:hypothetical protein
MSKMLWGGIREGGLLSSIHETGMAVDNDNAPGDKISLERNDSLGSIGTFDTSSISTDSTESFNRSKFW